MTDCPNGEIRDLLPDLLYGGLGAAERARVEAHLRDCVDCRDELELLRGMRGALRRAPAVDVDAITAAIPPYRPAVPRSPSRSWGGWRIAAAVTLLAAGGTSVVVARNGAPVADRSPVAVQRLDSVPGYARADAAVADDAPRASRAGAKAAAPRELALTGGTISELDDSELAALIDDVGSLNAVTPAEVDNAAAIGPITPLPPGGMNN
jgi:antitoxin (DNA-binding transcriptional repressor) of toxin-antitoxin stability system